MCPQDPLKMAEYPKCTIYKTCIFCTALVLIVTKISIPFGRHDTTLFLFRPMDYYCQLKNISSIFGLPESLLYTYRIYPLYLANPPTHMLFTSKKLVSLMPSPGDTCLTMRLVYLFMVAIVC